jgi:hypothetical protein
MKTKYATPTPTTAVFTRKDCSATYADVINIQAEFGFEYAAVVGSLIYLMNTYIRRNYALPLIIIANLNHSVSDVRSPRSQRSSRTTAEPTSCTVQESSILRTHDSGELHETITEQTTLY